MLNYIQTDKLTYEDVYYIEETQIYLGWNRETDNGSRMTLAYVQLRNCSQVTLGNPESLQD